MSAMSFSSLKADLNNVNLIEASAGTGKTYSIAILVLRLLLEEQIPIEKILLVTFTEDAAGELKSRCARFIRSGLHILEGREGEMDDNIKEIVCKGDKEEYKARLRQALLDIDKAKISTIHSFCQQTLSEFAFETGQSFGMEVWTNTDSIIDQELSDYWRNNITIKEPDYLVKSKLTDFDLYRKAVKLALSGKEFVTVGSFHQDLEKELKNVIPEIISGVKKRIEARNILTFDNMILSLYEKRKDADLKKYIREKYDAVFVDEFQDTDAYQYGIFYSFFQEEGNKIIFYIGDPKQSIYSFRNADLAVYRKAKQEVAASGGRVLSMNVNFRSTQELIEKCNEFFAEANGFHPFGTTSGIDYKSVSAHEKNDSKGLEIGGEPIKPFRISEHDNDEVYDQLTGYVKYLLCTNGLTLNGKPVKPQDIAIILRTNKQCRTIKSYLSKAGVPAVVIDDTNIFTTQEAKSYLYLLRALLETTESNINTFLMEPLCGLTAEELSKLNLEELLSIFKKCRVLWGEKGLPAVIEEIKYAVGIQSKWEHDAARGHRILSNLQQLTDLLQKQSTNMRLTPDDAYRFLKSQIKAGKPDEADQDTLSEYSVRIESDEEAVQILTIHKSKGLEFPLVLLADLELTTSPQWQHQYYSFKKDEQNCFVKYHTQKPKPNDSYQKILQLFKMQSEEENRRLIYVAVTRAMYHVYIFMKQAQAGTIQAYNNALGAKRSKSEFIDDPQQYSSNLSFKQQAVANALQLPAYPNISFPDKNYHKLSYSFISGAHGSPVISEAVNYDEDTYEHFIFKTLPKGNQTGNLLHQIFEFIDFTSTDRREEIIRRALLRHMPGKIQDEPFVENINQLVKNVLDVSLPGGFKLSAVERAKRINEFEFNFPVRKEIKLSDLENVVEDEQRIVTTGRSEVKGMMNGFVDLFFEHNGKYYILDWKSNHLGDTADCYNEDGLLQAMNANNYHLQYLIYTVAVHKYLTAVLPDYKYAAHFGGVYYLFLRGMHHSGSGGVYHIKPSEEEMNKVADILSR